MNTTGVDEYEGQRLLILYLYFKQLYDLKLLSLHSKLPKAYALWSKTSLKRWLGPQVTWLVPQVL
jgi:hypothetical protein